MHYEVVTRQKGHILMKQQITVLLGALCYVLSVIAHADFEGEVVVRWLENDGGADREMVLIEQFSYSDNLNKKWTVPKGAVVDGASIPKIFWGSIGPPFVGDYRRASVVHDYYCDVKTRPWKDVHRMFFDASLEGGVGKKKAKAMYAAVYARGPRWPTPGRMGAKSDPLPAIDEIELKKFLDTIESGQDISIEEIEKHLNQY